MSAPHGPIELRDGRLLYLGTMPEGKSTVCAAAESVDEGGSWRVVGRVPSPTGEEPGAFCEPHVAELPDGRLAGMFRYEHPDPERLFLWQSESGDGGRTWTPPRRTNIWGHPPHLLLLRDGRLLVSYGYRRWPFGQRACLSHDGGRTWDIGNEIVIRSDAPDQDLGYPATVQLRDDSLYTVYYQRHKPEEKPCILGSHWQLREA